jgi:hypothetical protein
MKNVDIDKHHQFIRHPQASISKGGDSIFVGFRFHGSLAANGSVGFRVSTGY